MHDRFPWEPVTYGNVEGVARWRLRHGKDVSASATTRRPRARKSECQEILTNRIRYLMYGETGTRIETMHSRPSHLVINVVAAYT